nr:YadA-like family protein [Bartonella sp. MM73XJBT.G]
MKKIYTTPKMSAVNNLKNSCSPYGFSFIKTLSLVSVAVFLSNASPVSACDLWGNVSTYFGGGANVRKSIAPTYIIDGSLYRDVGSAFLGVDRKFKGLEADLKLEIKNAFDTAFIGWGTWKQQIDKQFQTILSDMLVKQNTVGTITIGANKGGYVIDVANNSREARLITGVRNAALSPTSDQAVNGSQLYKLGIGVARSFGGGAGYDKSGNWIAPTFTVKAFDKNGNEVNKRYNSVAAAFTGVSDSFANLDKKIENVVTNVAGNSLVKQDDTGLITIGGKVSGAKVSIANSDSAARTLTGVNAGSITATSTDVINGSQLYSMNNVVAGYFGGGAEYKDGKWSAPTFTVKVFNEDGHGAETHYENVAAAFTGVSDSFTNLDKKIENVVTNVAGNSLVKQDDTGLITIGGKVSGAKVSIANSDSAARTLTGVDAGSITATSTDAINGSQLYSMSNLVASYFSRDAGYDADGKWNSPTFTVKVFNEDGAGEETHYENVADAFTGVSDSFANLDKKIENVVTNVAGNSLVKQDDTGLITIGGKVSGAKVSIANSDNALRTLTGVDAGSITATSTDAINGSQLYSMSNLVASYFSRDAGYDADGKWNSPTFTVKVFNEDGAGEETHYENVADAFTGVSDSFANLDKKIENVVTNVAGNSLVKQDDTGLITIGGKVSGAKVSIANSDNAVRTLTGVNAGSITALSTDAINGSQLYSMSNLVASYFSRDAGYDADGKWNSPTFTVKVFNEDGNGTETHYENVADALSGVSSSFTNLNQKIENVTSDSFVKQNSTGLITIGRNKAGDRIDITNDVNAPRVLSGVKGGAFTKTSTEAVNGSQLYLLSQAFASYFGGGAGYNDEGKWSGPTFTIKSFDEDGNETEHKYTNVADAFAGVNDVFKDLNQQIIDVKDGIDITEKSKVSQKNGDANDIITEGFPFMRMASVMRMLPVALDEMEDEVEGEDSGDTLAIGSKSPSKKVSILNSKGETRTLIDVAAGKLSADSTEAINGSQLYSLSTAVATSLGGEAGYNEKGEWKAPSFMVSQFKDGHLSEESYNNVASAFAGMNETLSIIDNRLSKVEKEGSSNGDSNGFPWNEEKGAYDVSHNGKDSKITHVADGDISKGSKDVVNGGQLWDTNNKVKDVADKVTEVEKKVDVAVSYDVEDGEKTNSISLTGGNESEPVLINNVANGKIEEGSKQAVNGGQLHDYTNEQMKTVLKKANEYTDEKVGNLINDSVNEAKSYTNMKFEALTYDINNVRKEARQAAAIGLAVSNLRYFDEPGSLSLSFGGGLWRGQSAFAVGAGYTSEDGKIRSNLSATSAGGHWGVGGGITLKLK